jgi:hypothetical protein
MDANELKEEILHQRELQKEYRKRLRVLEKQAAKFGIYVPPHVQIEVDELQEKISECEQEIDTNKKYFGKSLEIINEQISLLLRAAEGAPDFIILPEEANLQVLGLNNRMITLAQVYDTFAKLATQQNEKRQEISEIENL